MVAGGMVADQVSAVEQEGGEGAEEEGEGGEGGAKGSGGQYSGHALPFSPPPSFRSPVSMTRILVGIVIVSPFQLGICASGTLASRGELTIR